MFLVVAEFFIDMLRVRSSHSALVIVVLIVLAHLYYWLRCICVCGVCVWVGVGVGSVLVRATYICYSAPPRGDPGQQHN